MLLEGRKLVERATRWLVRSRPRPIEIEEEIAYRPRRRPPHRGPSAPARRRPRGRRAQDHRVRQGRRPEGAGGQGRRARGDVLRARHRRGRNSAAGEPTEEVAAVFHGWAPGSSSSGSATRSPPAARQPLADAGPGRAQGRALRHPRRSRARRCRPPCSACRPRPESTRTGRGAGVDRVFQIVNDIRMGELTSLETLSVALREVRNLIQSSGRVPAAPRVPPDEPPSGRIRPSPPPRKISRHPAVRWAPNRVEVAPMGSKPQESGHALEGGRSQVALEQVEHGLLDGALGRRLAEGHLAELLQRAADREPVPEAVEDPRVDVGGAADGRRASR